MFSKLLIRLLGRALLGATAAFCVLACSTPTAITDVWREPNRTATPLRNVVVFAQRLTGTSRHTLEDTFAVELGAHGVRATPSYRLFPDELPSRDAVRSALQQAGFDGALVSTARGIQERTTVDPGTPWVGGFYEYYGAGMTSVPYVWTDQYIRFESTLWDMRAGEGKMLWSAVTQTRNPSSGHDFATSLVKRVVVALGASGFVAPAATPEQPPVSLGAPEGTRG
jgi:hypothetical protein